MTWFPRVLTAAGLFLFATTSLATPPSFKIYVEDEAVYRVDFEALQAAGLETDLLASETLGMTCAGEEVPIHVEDGGDGLLNPGDWLEFVGRPLRGEVTYFDQHSRYNVYRLHTQATEPARMRPPEVPQGIPQKIERARYRSEDHLEEDLLRLRLPMAKNEEQEEIWYWQKLTFNAKAPSRHVFDFSHLPRQSDGRKVRLKIQLRGWSNPRSKPNPEVADHRVDFQWNGEPLTSSEWNGTQPHIVTIDQLEPERLRKGENVLELSVPRRSLGPEGDPLIDVVMLNWIEYSSPRNSLIDDPARLVLESPANRAQVRGSPGRKLLAFGDRGSRTPLVIDGGKGLAKFDISENETSFLVLGPEDLRTPAAVAFDKPSSLRNPDQGADYLMISHRTLLDAVQPLAEAHRRRGLRVAVVDLQDIYDEFHHGIAHPGAVRRFLQHTVEQWQAPVPRFVLLVGDASWDARNARAEDRNYADWTFRPWEEERFVKNSSSPYAEDAELNHRGLVPTWSYATREGHAASDNHFVTSDEGFRPRMAIGRIPVVKPDEVAQIVAKTVRYLETPEVGPWRRNALFITNESRAFQRQSEELADNIESRGFAIDRVYPDAKEGSNEHHTQKLLHAFNEGQVLIHFLGHGGRYIWRTGPPDLEKNHDLFTLDHLDQLTPGGRLPLVLSLTCYSAPFDHPNADSIGEKLLRLDQRGAIAVLAASWRNRPSPRWGQVLVEELTRPEATIGEAVMRAKHRVENQIYVETYNLLGDPALPLGLPTGQVHLDVTRASEGALLVQGEVSLDDFQGQVLIEALDAQGEPLATSTVETETPAFRLDLPLDASSAEVERVRAYAWNEEQRVDAAGAFEIEIPSPMTLETVGTTSP